MLVDFKELIGKKAIIKGEAGSGKTRLTEKLINEAINFFPPSEITIMDFAPPRILMEGFTIGGNINVPSGVIHLRPEKIYAPRIEGKTKEEVLEFAKRNAESIEKIFSLYKRNPTKVLFINDITIYFHAGSLENLLNIIELSNTFICNAYEGKRLSDDKGSGVSEREKLMLRKFEEHMNIIINL
ncbi:MAG: hypothetical protein RMI53_06795 [Nitrososphaerota archaeon]|nr:hypothetical protein [Nitrososphaerota archaeon]